jgi:hypothetical protein
MRKASFAGRESRLLTRDELTGVGVTAAFWKAMLKINEGRAAIATAYTETPGLAVPGVG